MLCLAQLADIADGWVFVALLAAPAVGAIFSLIIYQRKPILGATTLFYYLAIPIGFLVFPLILILLFPGGPILGLLHIVIPLFLNSTPQQPCGFPVITKDVQPRGFPVEPNESQRDE